jgi:limonene 1,2-monooxygenase|tara:strand:- start:382 stop:1179 length:798 start_codon:yes stop_codon:yes gene_type:complete
MQESLEIMVRLLESPEPISFKGKYWDIQNMAIQLRSYQKPRLKIALATSGSRGSLELAGKYGAILFSPLSAVGPGRLPLKEHYEVAKMSSRKSGQHFEKEDWRVVTYVYLSDNSRQARQDVMEGIERDWKDYFWVINGGILPDWAKGKDSSKITADLITEKFRWVVGTPDEAIEQIEKINEEAGGIGGVMLTTHEWISPEKQKRSLELFARYVIPHFKGHTSDLKREWERTQELNSQGKLPFLLGSDLSSEYPLGGSKSNLEPEK